jgi:DNA polymerase-4
MNKIILHIDFDSFFASVEQQYNPKLRGRPVGVVAQNGRTCIIAASKEAKKLGVKSPSRTFEAIKIAPDIVFVPAHFNLYWEQTKKFINICKDYSPFVELFSLDEVFMDVTATIPLFKSPYAIAEKIKERIKKEIGEFITVSVGISYNKLLAKLASGIKKPDGLFEITKNNLDEVYKNVQLTDFCGIGEKIRLRLNRLGIYTPIDLKNASPKMLIREFKEIEGNFLKSIGLGIDNSEVNPYYKKIEAKSVGRSYCLLKNEYNKRIIFQNIYELCEEVALKLRRLGKSAKTAGIYLGGSISVSGRKTKNYFNSGSDLYRICLEILKDNNFYLSKSDYIRRISIWVGNLEDDKNLTIPLFYFQSKKDKLLKTVDKINEKFGDHTIRNGFLLYADKLTTVPNGYMADKYERAKLALFAT